MNFYKHHIGDYAKHTDHLSWDEDQAYSRLMRVYYRDEKPLPLDIAKVIRLARAKTRPQRAAVEAVLEEFFFRDADGWHNKRADEEIAIARESGEDAGEKRENRYERQRRHREERRQLFEILREANIVMPFNTRTETLRLRVTALDSDASVTHSLRVTGDAPLHTETGEATAIQTPDSRHQTPLAISEVERASAPPSKRGTRIPPDFDLTPERRAYAEAHGIDADQTFQLFTTYWRGKSGAGATKIDWDSTWQHWCLKDQERRKPRKTRFEELSSRDPEAHRDQGFG